MTTTLEQLKAGELAGARHLKLGGGLTEFPREIFELADTLEVLDLSGNALGTLPDDLPRLAKLRVLFASNNPFTELPAVLGECGQLSMVGFKANRIREVPGAALPPRLRWLILTDNEIAALPPELGRCAELQKLMLAGNRLSALPDEMAACTRLELVRLAANRFEALPEWLLRLPRLAWLGYAGNPCAAAAEADAAADGAVGEIGWATLALGQKLGEGASGVIYRAIRLSADHHPQQAVAVKLFKGAVTSDGLPDREMAACLHAGAQPNLIGALGKLKGHPIGEQGLVMPLIEHDFEVLAAPPSFDSCTRDVYPDDRRFDLGATLRIAHGIASAAAHLHRRGILHGDLYAHNILHDGAGHALLGDFGAASLYGPRGAAPGLALQRIEVRAFGCLLEELLERTEAHRSAALDALAALTAACLSPDVGSRPGFEAIVERLRVHLAR
ncbi:leucine-rich repeat-containing protein kinase family protein [Burkholderia plantarii]|uniref:Serine/threonine protein kinase n=1 Tax=Burkholderia plantarii TaxID=41899 RepID=A0A0B6S1V5_BURPL|nr:leucine-rich repeat-containing protein kinase family protein [Burkholderia plantarii]AJK49658.1 serine/threonine protein kinase [Burkholderia plantarii]